MGTKVMPAFNDHAPFSIRHIPNGIDVLDIVGLAPLLGRRVEVRLDLAGWAEGTVTHIDTRYGELAVVTDDGRIWRGHEWQTRPVSPPRPGKEELAP